METRKLYYEDCHLREFSARVVSCTPAGSLWQVTLDATAFYPEGGGQAGDRGHLGAVEVVDTRELDGEIRHLCTGPLAPGAEVVGAIDYAHRFDLMQQHTGEHMVSGVLHRRFGCHNVGFHMGADTVTIDFDLPIPQEALPEVEAEVNEAIWRNLPLHIWTPEPEELLRVPYRTKRPLPWPVRIVEIPGVDICACCGVHVAATGEIGLVKLLSATGFHGGVRMEMVCGRRAMTLLNGVFAQNRQVSQAFSAKILETGEAARQISAQLAREKYRSGGLLQELFATIAASAAGMGNVAVFRPGLASGEVRMLADRLAETCGGSAGVFSPREAGGYSYCLIAREGNLVPLGRAMTETLGGRGGGKSGFQQGYVQSDRDSIAAFFHRHGWKVLE